jgi:hypothetical protein
MSLNTLPNKEDISYLVIRELKWLRHDKKVIPFPIIFKKICPTLHLRKNEIRSILVELEKKGLIEIIPFHGIILR